MFTALEDIKLETVDFGWIKQTTKISHLKRAIRLIEMDGNYFTELKDACFDRIGELDPAQKRVKVDNQMLPEVKAEIEKELQQWETQLCSGQRGKSKSKQSVDLHEGEPDIEAYFDNEQKKGNNAKMAENQKVKGNEALKSKDFQEAIGYYTRSIQYDPTLYQAYGNRALAYIRIKQFQRALSDCQEALTINPQYIKAYHRKAKAFVGINNKVQAYKTLQEALKIEPENTQINGQLRDLRQQMKSEELRELEGGSKFKKIAIEEDSEEEEELQEN